jgi:hypothetical protein
MILKIMIGIKEHIIFYSLRFEIKNIYIIILIFIFNINIFFIIRLLIKIILL